MYATLRPKESDRTPQACLQRLIHERLDPSERVDVTPESCSIREESWGLDRLELLSRKHDRSEPKYEHGPVIVFEHRDDHLLVDGNNRVNLWRNTRAQGLRQVILIRRAE